MSDRPWFRIFTSVTLQPYANIETLVIDSYSTDRTRDIAVSYQTRVILCEGKLLAARYLGCKEAKGSYIVFVDTDQILEPTAIERAVALMDNYDMLVFEELSYNIEGFIPRLYSVSRQMVNTHFDKPFAFDAVKGVNPARVYQRDVLTKVFAAIPQEVIPETIHYDHDIIYYECYKISRRVGVLHNAAYNIEPGWSKLWRTNYRYGASLQTIRESYYWEIFLKKRGSGLFFGRPVIPGLQTFLLAMIIRIINKLGYYFGHA